MNEIPNEPDAGRLAAVRERPSRTDVLAIPCGASATAGGKWAAGKTA